MSELQKINTKNIYNNYKLSKYNKNIILYYILEYNHGYIII